MVEPAESACVGRMAQLAAELLGSLNGAERRLALWLPWGSAEVEDERLRWYYTPTDHGGIALSHLKPRQQSLAMRLLAEGLTESAYNTASIIMGLENVLDRTEGWGVDWGRERGRDPGLYWLRIFGDPSGDTWAWRFGGHHISVNVLLQGGAVRSTTPSFLGADPASSPVAAGVLRPIGGIEDTARSLFQLLDGQAQSQAMLHPRAISDIVSGNRPRVRVGDEMLHIPDLFRGRLRQPRLSALANEMDRRAEGGTGYSILDHRQMAINADNGFSATDMNDVQRANLRSLIGAFTDRSPEPVAEALTAHYAEDHHLDVIRFGWAGTPAPAGPHYFRVIGPQILCEYDNTQRAANHAHSVWRDPMNDFGLDPLPVTFT